MRTMFVQLPATEGSFARELNDVMRRMKGLINKRFTTGPDIRERTNEKKSQDSAKWEKAGLVALYQKICEEIEAEHAEPALNVKPKKKKKKKPEHHSASTLAAPTKVENNDPLIALKKIYAMVYENAEEAPTASDISKLKEAPRDDKLWNALQRGVTGTQERTAAGLYAKKLKECGAYDVLFPEKSVTPEVSFRESLYTGLIDGLLGKTSQGGLFAQKSTSAVTPAPAVSHTSTLTLRASTAVSS
jgi:hypothetical protein